MPRYFEVREPGSGKPLGVLITCDDFEPGEVARRFFRLDQVVIELANEQTTQVAYETPMTAQDREQLKKPAKKAKQR